MSVVPADQLTSAGPSPRFLSRISFLDPEPPFLSVLAGQSSILVRLVGSQLLFMASLLWESPNNIPV